MIKNLIFFLVHLVDGLLYPINNVARGHIARKNWSRGNERQFFANHKDYLLNSYSGKSVSLSI